MTQAPNTIALVTGASRGIGFETARQLGQKGITVILTGRNQEQGEAAAQTLVAEGLAAHFLELDVAQTASVIDAARNIEQTYGKLDILLNNAAAYADWGETASGADLEHAQDVLNINLFGTWRVIQAFLPLLKKSQHGRVVNVSSGAGSHGEKQFGLTTGPTATSYAVSKAALNALTVKFANEIKEQRILVNAVDPGLTATAPGMEEMGARPVAEGAASVAWAATLPDDGPTGGFFRDGMPLLW